MFLFIHLHLVSLNSGYRHVNIHRILVAHSPIFVGYFLHLVVSGKQMKTPFLDNVHLKEKLYTVSKRVLNFH